MPNWVRNRMTVKFEDDTFKANGNGMQILNFIMKPFCTEECVFDFEKLLWFNQRSFLFKEYLFHVKATFFIFKLKMLFCQREKSYRTFSLVTLTYYFPKIRTRRISEK